MNDESKPPRAPPGLGAAGKRQWRSAVNRYEFWPHELLGLERACRQADDNAALEVARVGQPVMIEGSRGQLRVNPLYAELRAGRESVNRQMAALGLADALDADAASRSSAARRLVRARWDRR